MSPCHRYHCRPCCRARHRLGRCCSGPVETLGGCSLVARLQDHAHPHPPREPWQRLSGFVRRIQGATRQIHGARRTDDGRGGMVGLLLHSNPYPAGEGTGCVWHSSIPPSRRAGARLISTLSRTLNQYTYVYSSRIRILCRPNSGQRCVRPQSKGLGETHLLLGCREPPCAHCQGATTVYTPNPAAIAATDRRP